MTVRTSIVIASGAGGPFLFRCLASLRAQADSRGAEIVVVDRTGEATRRRIATEYPAVRVIEAPDQPAPTVPRMRRLGAEAARGAIVAVIEEHCTATAAWLETIEQAFRPGDAAIGGPILDDGYARLRDWVVYFSEYHAFMPPWTNGPRARLNGANIAYDRARLLAHRDVLDAGYWEVVLHPRLAQDGALRAVDAMRARHTGPFDFGYYLRQRYLLSRVWGGSRREVESVARRAAHVVLAPVLPFAMLARMAVCVSRSGRHAGRFVAALPMLFMAMCALAIGETIGYLAGPGPALEAVE